MVEGTEEGSTLLSCEQTRPDRYILDGRSSNVDLARLANPVRTLQKREKSRSDRPPHHCDSHPVQALMGKGKEEKKNFPHPGQQRKEEISL